MSFLSTAENGFSGIPQNISDGSCATQYKMAAEGVSGNCAEVNMFIHDSSGDEQPFVTHINDNFFHTKFKIDPSELYTFHDSDVIAGEITVSHTDDSFIFSDDVKPKLLDSPGKETELIDTLANGEVKKEKNKTISNGHYTSTKTQLVKHQVTHKESSTKAPRTKSQSQVNKDLVRKNSVSEVQRLSVQSPKGGIESSSFPKSSTQIVNTQSINVKSSTTTSQSGGETFLDVFKREQGLVESSHVVFQTESQGPSGNSHVVFQTESPRPSVPAPQTPPKPPPPVTKKTPSAGKTAQAKPKRGRGPAVHEALQRIPAQRRALPLSTGEWHAPGDNLFSCGPLDDKSKVPFTQESSSSDDDNMPDFEAGIGPVCVEESAAESRSARLELRKAALRRHVMQADTAMRLKKDYRRPREVASLIKKQLGQGPTCRLPQLIINHLLASRGIPSLLTSKERRRLREVGWSGGESGSTESKSGTTCAEEKCTQTPMPCARYCMSHMTLDPEQRLYAACAAVFAGGSRCMQPLLPLNDQTPLCAEHAWKRDNYDKLSRDAKPKKSAAVRTRPWPPAPRPPRPPRRPKRRKRPPARPRPNPHQSLSEINVCSNSSTYDSSEDTNMGALSESEYITSANAPELEVEVGQVPPDDILDPAVLSQIPDEAFTEFFNQAEAGATFVESSELAAALEALDERALDNIDCVFPTHHVVKARMQQVPAVSMQSSAPS